MKKTNFTFSFLGEVQHSIFSNVLRSLAVLSLCLFLSHGQLFSQSGPDDESCVLVCNDAQVSLDMDCSAEVIPSMVAFTDACPDGNFEVHVMTLDGDTLPSSPFVGFDQLDQYLMVSVFDLESGNSCWSTILVQDKMPPVMDCDCTEEPVSSISGLLSGADPSYNRIFFSTPDDPTTCILSGVGTNVNYETYDFGVSVAGMYTFTCTATFDAVGAIYLGGFDSSDPCDNVIGYDDDGGAGLNPLIEITLNLTPGYYTLVTSSFANGQGGDFSWDITGPGDVIQQCVISCTDINPQLTEPAVVDNCSGATIIQVDEDIEDICNPYFIRKLTRWYTAVDASGNYADTCKQVFYLERIDFDDIVWPGDRTMAAQNPLLCDENFPLDSDGNPRPDGPGGTGVPTINGDPIFPDFDLTCNSAASYDDVDLGQIGCVRKIMRMWTVREWHCQGEQDTMFVQQIEIVDNEGPQVTCPLDVQVTTNTSSCTATYLIPSVGAVDNCNSISQVTVTYPGGFQNQNGGFYESLPVGDNLITYTVYDDCLNSNECSYTVTVMDDTPPVPVCDEHTVVSLTGYEIGGLTTVPAHVFDDGSYDDCGPITFVARRMDSCIDFDWTTQGAGVDYDPDGQVNSRDRGVVDRTRVPFACCDVAADDPIMIVLTVTDESGNSNTCMVEVVVQDKIKPIIDCPSPITISCEYNYDLDNLSEFGVIRTAGEDIAEWCVFDPTNDNADNDGFVCGTDGLVIDNCDLNLDETVTAEINNCGVGTITRRFVASDANGSDDCEQVITVTNFDPIETQDITWPLDYTGVECFLGTDPDDLPAIYSRPVINEDACDLVGINYEDQEFPFVEGACFKILRTWQVIEWCLFEELGGLVEGKNYWVHQQVIKVENSFGPEFQTEQPFIYECNEFDCGGLFIDLVQTATDDCTPGDELVWSWQLDAFSNGVINDGDSGTGNTINASNTYPIGEHRIIYTFEDKCGNRTTQEQFFTIESCKKPTPVCINGLSADLMGVDADGDGNPDGGMVVVWASDFDASSYHACGLPVTVSFSEDPNDLSRTFDCSHVGGQTPVRIYAHDSNGRFDYCETYIIIQDNMNVCGGNTGGATGVISGEVITESSLEVAEVEVSMMGSNMLPVVTTSAGVYNFPAMPLGGAYEISPKRDGDDKNGVSTLDLVRIQRHLLGIEAFTSPYDMIAADANNSGSVSAIDLIELRKLILGIYDDLPSNTSWRFVDDQYAFADPFNPWMEAFPETYLVNELNTDMPDIDFVAIKVGDLNNTVVTNATQVVTRNAPGSLEFAVDQQDLNAGEIVTVPVYASDFDAIRGFQFTMNFDPGKIEVMDVTGVALDITADMIGMNRLAEGMFTMSWFDLDGRTLADDDILYEVRFAVKEDGSLEKMLSVTSDVTSAEAYAATEDVLDLNLVFRGSAAPEFELFQNRPNPFNQMTTIAFSLPEASPATLTVFDVTGKALRTIEVDGVKGYNEVQVSQDQLGATGVLYYQLTSEGYMATRKMVVTN